MPNLLSFKWLVLAIVGAAIGAGLTLYVTQQDSVSYDDEVHVHADFLLYVNGERLRFTDAKYQSDLEQILHPDLHFHDGNDEVIHRHADGQMLTAFMDSLGWQLNNECLVSDEGESYCSDGNNELKLYVNGEQITNIESYEPQDLDQVLLYYGEPNAAVISELLAQVTDTACIYSGLCPERGTPPPESCGLSCELE